VTPVSEDLIFLSNDFADDNVLSLLSLILFVVIKRNKMIVKNM